MLKQFSSFSEYPHLTCYWKVLFDGIPFTAYEVSGLNEKLEYHSEPTEDGNQGSKSLSMAPSKGGHLTIKWGLFSANLNGAHLFHRWREERLAQPERKVTVDIIITLLDEYGNDVIQWNCLNCLPIEYQGPSLRADENAIAMQTLVLDVEKIQSQFKQY